MTGADERPRRPLLIGISGPIGCGKSTVAGILRGLGGTVIDADALARRATAAGSATLPLIRERFGDAVFDDAGMLDRAALADQVFGDPIALADLERIVHPRVRGLVEQELQRATANDSPFNVIEAIKLVEGGLAMSCDEVWLIACEPGTQRERLAARGADPADSEQRLEAQGPSLVARLSDLLAAQGAGAHGRRPRLRTISTEGTLDDTRERVEDALADALDDERRRV